VLERGEDRSRSGAARIAAALAVVRDGAQCERKLAAPLERVRADVVQRRPLDRGQRVVGRPQPVVGAVGGDVVGGGLLRDPAAAAVGVMAQRFSQRAVVTRAHDDLQLRGVDPPQQRRDPFHVGRVGLVGPLYDERSTRTRGDYVAQQLGEPVCEALGPSRRVEARPLLGRRQ